MVLMVTIFSVGSGLFSPRQKLESALNDIERAIRFATDEAAIRNKIVRVTLNLSKEPHQFSVEYGPDENFILPKRITEIGGQRSLEELEEDSKVLKKLNRQFSKVEEFQDGASQFSDQVRIIAVGSTLGNLFLTDGEISLYFYPSGEKDSAIIILGTQNEIATLETEAFTMDFKRTIAPLENQERNDDPYDTQLKKAQDFYEKWSKK